MAFTMQANLIFLYLKFTEYVMIFHQFMHYLTSGFSESA